MLIFSHLFSSIFIYSHLFSSIIDCFHLFSTICIYPHLFSSILIYAHVFSYILIYSQPSDICATIVTDRQYLSDNLLCLVSNAVKFSDRGGTIDVRVRLEDRYSLVRSRIGSFENLIVHTSSQELSYTPMLLVTVTDTGVGLTDDAMVTLFHTTKQVRNSGGTGLGLYSLAKRIEALGGKYGVQSRPDGQQGSLFWFTFPYRPCTPSFLHPRSSSFKSDGGVSIQSGVGKGETGTGGRGTCGRGTGGVSAHGGGDTQPRRVVRQPPTVLPSLRVLLVDDSSAVLKITSRFLKANGHTVETADNGYQCLERLKRGMRDFDVLITDLQMPVMDGFTAVREYRKGEDCLLFLSKGESKEEGEGKGEGEGFGMGEDVKHCRLYIIGMSANSDEESVKDALAAGMDDFVTKPFSYEVLAVTLKGALLATR